MVERVDLLEVAGGAFAPHFAGASVGGWSVGPEGLLDRLELELGLPPPPSWLDRVLHLAHTRRADHDDPFGAAAAALRLADALRAEGARVEHLPPRWRRSIDVAMETPGGLAHRVERVLAARVAALRPRPLCVYHGNLPGALRPLLAALTSAGWTLSTPPAPPAVTASVVRVSAGTPAAVAERVALATAHARPVVWVAPDRCLARALDATGGPALGLDPAASAGWVAPALALAFAPQHPRDLLALLCADAPLPVAVRRRLADALREWPSWRGAAWAKARAEAAALAPDGGDAVAWVDALLTPLADEAGGARIDALRDRFRALAVPPAAGGGSASPLCERYLTLLARLHGDSITRPEAEGLLRLAVASVDAPSGDTPQAGAFVLPSPGAVVAPIDHLVLWNAAAAPPDPFAALLPAERTHLARHGVTLPDRASRVAAWSRDVLRAVSLTRRVAWLCLPDVDARGEAYDPPPWRHELPASEHLPATATASVPRLVAPRPVDRWTVDPSRLRPRRESPSSASRRIGCPLHDALRRDGDLAEPRLPALPPAALLRGRVAHAAFESTFRHAPADLSPDAAREAARAAAERVIDADATPLALPSARGKRAHVVRVVGEAAATLTRSLRATGERVAGVEVELGVGLSLAHARWYGRADLVTGPTPAVIDLKWSPGSHRAALAQGAALQLALYAWMLRGRNDLADDDWPAVGYLVVTSGGLLGSASLALDGAERVRGPSPAATVRAAAQALARRAAERERGELLAPGALRAPTREGITEGVLTLAPPCGYCPHGALCGRGGAP